MSTRHAMYITVLVSRTMFTMYRLHATCTLYDITMNTTSTMHTFNTMYNVYIVHIVYHVHNVNIVLVVHMICIAHDLYTGSNAYHVYVVVDTCYNLQHINSYNAQIVYMEYMHNLC